MSESPWLTIVGLGEDGPDGLSPASRSALAAAEVVMGPPRHLSLLPGTGAERVAWPVPFAEGLPLLLSYRGRPTVALASGDPFWFGAGRAIAGALTPGEWRALPGPSSLSLAAARLGWPLEDVTCLGLHAAPLSRVRPHLAPGVRILATLRDGGALAELGRILDAAGFGDSRVHSLEALGGPRERIASGRAADLAESSAHPVIAAIEVAGAGAVVGRASGRADALFHGDGQMTKRPVRALTLSALAPCPGERLWDIGGGSGSVAVEWLLSDPACAAVSIERHAARAAAIRANADRLGQDRLHVIEGTAPQALSGVPAPDAVFVGGGLSEGLLEAVRAAAPGARIVANAVTLESEALLTRWQDRLGGDLMRIELSTARPLGSRRGWAAAYPVVQWCYVP